VHTSDVHLESDTFGSGVSGDRMRQRLRRAFSAVIELANARHAELLLIAGDLFDSSRVPDEALTFALDTIAAARMPVAMIPGNHDAHDERSIYAALRAEELPSNLHLFLEPEGRVVDFPELSARVWGRALVAHSPAYRPLSGLPPAEHGVWNIALAHGLLVDDGNDGERSSPISPQEIEASGYDYLALGHVHVFSDVSCGSTTAFYCGTPGPLYEGDEAGWVACVDCVPGRPPSVERVSVLH